MKYWTKGGEIQHIKGAFWEWERKRDLRIYKMNVKGHISDLKREMRIAVEISLIGLIGLLQFILWTIPPIY